MLVLVSVSLALLTTCLALPQVRQVTSSNSLPEDYPPHIPWGPGGLADFPEIVDETNLANEAPQQAVQPAPDNIIAQINEIWDPFLDPEFNPVDETAIEDFKEPINMVIANMLAGINPPAILNGPAVNNANQLHVQQPEVFIDENEDEEIDAGNTSLHDITEVDFSEDPGSTGLGYVDEMTSDSSQPFAYHPMVKRDVGLQKRDRGTGGESVDGTSSQEVVKSELKIITPAQWEFWYEALSDTAFGPLYDNIHAATDLGLDLEQAAFQAARISKGAMNPNAYLKLVFYPMYDKIKQFALISDSEDMAKELFDYQEPVKGMAEVNDSAIKEFLESFTDSSLAFSATAANIAGGDRKIKFTTNSEATSFESWAKDPSNASQGLVDLIKDLSTAIQIVFSALSTLQANYGFLGAQYQDIDFDEMAAEVDEDFVVEYPSVPAKASVKPDATSGLDPDGDMFRSRELPKVLPPIDSPQAAA
ncbi:hypothetical protein TWF718_009814 [Orbilia javanica]|uniref:Uncharacterized protein n=1 Tax=Orbilia javanica TaxID=47235 RepID=A0AAN8RG26_9PEZI